MVSDMFGIYGIIRGVVMVLVGRGMLASRQWCRPKTARRGGCVVGNILATPLATPSFEILAIICLLLVYMSKY